MRRIEEIPERLKSVFERMNLSPEEQQRRWEGAQRRQNERHDADVEYKEWLEENRLTDARYPTQLAAAHMRMEYADLAIITVDQSALTLVSPSLVRRHTVFPVKFENNKLYLAVIDLSPLEAISEAVSYEIVPVLASPQAIQYRIEKHFAA